MGNISITNTLTNGSVVDADDLNENFTDITSVVNGNVDGTNISASSVLTIATLTANTSISTDTIAEKTSATGVTIDGVLIKDNLSTSGITPIDGWISTGTFTYASATTITVASGAASIYQINDNLRFKQTAGTYKYFKIAGVADTVLTVNGAGLYTVLNEAITVPAYSHGANPLGFPINMIPGYVKCSVSLGADMANLVSGTNTKVLLDAEAYDINSNFAAYKFIAPVGGYYSVTGSVYFYTNILDAKLFTIYIYKNNATILQGQIHSSGTSALTLLVAGNVLLAKDDYIELFAAHATGANTVSLYGNPLVTFMHIVLISII